MYSLVEGNKIFSFFLLCFFDFLASPRSFFWVCKSLDCQVSKRRTEWNIRKWLGKRGRLLNLISAHVLQRIIEKIVVYYSSRWYSSSFFPSTPWLVVLRAAAPTTSAAAVVTSCYTAYVSMVETTTSTTLRICDDQKTQSSDKRVYWFGLGFAFETVWIYSHM